MDKIQHSFLDVRGLKLHIAEIGTGPAVVFLHGFPEIWYSWRHQMIAVAESGFRAITPDFRGYGLSEQPKEPEKTTFKDLVDDLLVILDKLNIPKILLVGKDFGARVVYHFALFHPERVEAIVTLGVPFILTGPEAFPRDSLPKGFYMLRWQEPGRAEKDFGRFDVKTVVKNIYIMFSGNELPCAEENEEIMDLVDPSTPLPIWFTEQDLQEYAALYENSSFKTALQVPYREVNCPLDILQGVNLQKNPPCKILEALCRAWLEDYGIDELKVQVPSLLIMGEDDYALKFGGFDNYIRSGIVKNYVPDLETIFVPQGTHFVQEQFPDKVNNLLITFLNKYKLHL